MSKTDTSPGLLSKMVKFVRNPATNWSDLDAAQTDREDALSKQMLKEMIERKRSNDFVRKREFDMLRKMRKREAMTGIAQEPGGGQPSFFQSSLPSGPDDRAQTLKKIDEIEAQMSMQWWKTKAVNTSQQPALPTNKPMPPASLPGQALPKSYRPTVPAALAEASAAAPAFPDTTNAWPPRDQAFELSGVPASGAQGSVDTEAPQGSFQSTSFSPSKSSAVEVGDAFVHDAETEEAAIRFANGDDDGAEAGLLAILAPGGSRENHVDTWLTLFDLYRANGWQDKFESAAIEFVGRFDRSAPQWFSMPTMVEKFRQPSNAAAAGRAAHWICPSVVGLQTVAALKAALTRAATPWRLDWHNLKAIEEAAAQPLYKVFSSWAEQAVELHFIGDAQLQSALQRVTVSGDRSVAHAWWLLRMAALRVTHRPDDFELTALDFCVTYELSPPAWEMPQCRYKALTVQGEAEESSTIIGEVYRDSGMSSLLTSEGDSQFEGSASQLSTIASGELSGQIQGDMTMALDKLHHQFVGAEVLVISCAKLIRVDFSAAGALLNWVSAREEERLHVQFAEVNRLVAAFFNVIGITEHATVTVRTD
jgi:ABC-type transporter Mla MlaB component